MIPNSVIENILDQADIAEVIGDFVKLEKKGQNFKGLSPFVHEKTPSFVVSPSKRIFSCFSSGTSGGVVAFLKKYKGMSFVQAINYLADKYKIEIPQEEALDQEEINARQTKEALFNLNEFAASFFHRALPSSKAASDYAGKRISADNQTEFNIGFACDEWHKFQQTALDEGYSLTNLLLSGLVVQNDQGNNFDFFRNRLIFPIHNYLGRICAFAGRSLDDTKPKYLNIKGTPVFSKSHTLYGLFFAQQSIRKLDYAVLVEGYTDVISLHSAGVLNSVAPCGTALTPEQCKLLARYSENIVLFYDGDAPGKDAAVKNAHVCLENGLIPSIVPLPKDEDPDSYIQHHQGEDIPEFILKTRIDFPLWYADLLFVNPTVDPTVRNDALKTICNTLVKYSEESLVHLFVTSIAKKHKFVRSHIEDKVKHLKALAEGVSANMDLRLPAHVDPKEFQKWGFYEDHHQYYFDTKDGIKKLSNFVMKPLFHVESTVDTRRIFELTNFAGYKVTIDFDMSEMTSLVNFTRVIEGKGNFLFWGLLAQLIKLKLKWYEETRSCSAIHNLGWQKEGFWAWSNGISTESGFFPIDTNGLVLFNGKHYFIPAFSDIYIDDKSIFLDERKFIFIDRKTSIREWSNLFIKVFGINAKFGIAFYISSLFRDHLLHLFSNFPILNLFGPKGSGKSQMAMSLSCLYGKQQTPFNIHNGTKAGLAEHIQQFINGFAWIDEYKNNIDYDKIETLKSIYDAIGRNRLNYDKGKKKETTQVNSAVTLSGQEMPTADVALFSRVIFLQFHKTEYSAEEKEDYDRLKNYEKQGLSHITADILKHRAFFVENYFHQYDIVLKDLFSLLKENVVEDRILRNWCVILTSIRVLSSKLDLPFSYEELAGEAIKLITNQNKQISSSNEIAVFWDMLEAMFDNNEIIDRWHFLITRATSISGVKEQIVFPDSREVLKFKFNSIYKIYSEHARRQNNKALPATTLKYYLENSKYFMGVEKSTRFSRKDYSAAEGKAIEQRQVTSSWCFDYEELKINLIRTDKFDENSSDIVATTSFHEKSESDENLPF